MATESSKRDIVTRSQFNQSREQQLTDEIPSNDDSREKENGSDWSDWLNQRYLEDTGSIGDDSSDKKLKSEEEELHHDHKPQNGGTPECYVAKLPPEVCRAIFQNLSWKDRKMVRLTCRAWNETCYLDVVNMHIDGSDNSPIDYGRLVNCQFDRWNLSFKDVRQNNLPENGVLEEIGTYLISLHFRYSALGDQIMKSIILFCDKLRHLKIDLTPVETEDAFCSLEMLSGLNVVRNNLKTFEITNGSCIDYEMDTWKPIFVAFLSIFPNIQMYSSGHIDREENNSNDETFAFTIKVDKDKWIEDPLHYREIVAACLTYGISSNVNHWTLAVQDLYELSLTSISLVFVKSDLNENAHDMELLLDFFGRPNKLEDIRVELSGKLQIAMVKMLLFKILGNCPKLRSLHLIRSSKSFNRYTHASLQYFWLHHLTTYECEQLRSEASHLQDLCFDGFQIQGSRMHTACGKSYETILCYWFERSLECISSHFSHLEHLTISNRISGMGLQTIARNLLNLKTLIVNFLSGNIDFAFTGSRSGRMGEYSIDRLQHLERLKIEWPSQYDFDDVIFNRFNLPKLRYLSFHSPKDDGCLLRLVRQLPALVKVDFSSEEKINPKTVAEFCSRANNLHSIQLNRGRYKKHEVEMFFSRCPSLRFFHSTSGTYYWDPFSKTVIKHFESAIDGKCVVQTR